MVTRPLQIYGEMQHGIFSREKASWTAPRQQERESGGVAGLKMEQRRSFKFDESPGCFQNFENRLMCSTWAQSPRRQAEPRAGWGLVSRGHIFSTRATNYYRFFRCRNLFRSGLRRTLDTHTHTDDAPCHYMLAQSEFTSLGSGSVVVLASQTDTESIICPGCTASQGADGPPASL